MDSPCSAAWAVTPHAPKTGHFTPTAVFPIVWTINSTCTIAGSRPCDESGGTNSGTQAAYFGLRSPINAAVVTLLYTAATASSLRAVLTMCEPMGRTFSGHDPGVASLANPVGLTTAGWNRDPFWKAGPLSQPPSGWTK